MLSALLVTILLCGIIGFNILLLGDFFFVYFIAFITSVSLRSLKHSIIETLEHSLSNPFSLVASTWIYSILQEVIFIIKQRSVIDTIKRFVDKFNTKWEKMIVERKTIFNDLKTLLTLLALYIGFTRLGSYKFALIFLAYATVEFIIKSTLDVTFWLL